MVDGDGEIVVNRAPVLTLWAAIVAERLEHDADAAITLGRAVAGSSARIKARAIGLEEKHCPSAVGLDADQRHNILNVCISAGSAFCAD